MTVLVDYFLNALACSFPAVFQLYHILVHHEPDSTRAGHRSPSLYRNAVEQNEQLTKVERLLFLSRLDLSRKALAVPKSLIGEEIDLLFCRPPPEVLVANIKLIFGLDPIAEVIRDHGSPDQIAQLNWDQLVFITLQLWAKVTEDVHRIDEPHGDGVSDPVRLAAGEFLEILRPEEAAFERAVTLRFCSGDYTSAKNGGELVEAQALQKSDEEWLRLREE